MNSVLQHKENVLQRTQGESNLPYLGGYVQALSDILNTEVGDVQ